MEDRKRLAMEVTMVALQRRVLPLQGETAVEHAKRLFEIGEQCMAACLPEAAAEPTPAEPAAEAKPPVVDLTKLIGTWVWDKPTRAPYINVVKNKTRWD